MFILNTIKDYFLNFLGVGVEEGCLLISKSYILT